MVEPGLVDLQRGGTRATLFVFPGSCGEAEEVQPLADELASARPVVAVLPFSPVDGALPDRVEEMAAQAADLISGRDPHGPYYLAGYSFGGILALETADLLRRRGGTVALTVVVDPVYHHQHWPMRQFVAAAVRRTATHLGRIARQPPAQGLHELRYYSGRLAKRLAARSGSGNVEGAEVVNPGDSVSLLEATNFTATRQWIPRHFSGPVVLLTSGGRLDFGSDPAALWTPYIEDLRVRRLTGDHLGLVEDPASVAEVARQVEAALEEVEEPDRPRVLLASTFAWATPGRLAVALDDAGFVVDAIGPRGSVLHGMNAVRRSHGMSLARPMASLSRAIEAAAPTLVIPTDDPTRQALHRLYADADPTTPEGRATRALLVTSLGHPKMFPVIYSRSTVMEIAAEQGCAVPAGAASPSLDAGLDWLSRNPGPAVMKVDGSWGGRGVEVVCNEMQAREAWSRLTSAPGIARIAKRLVIDREAWPLRDRLEGRQVVVTLQRFVRGSPANAAVACLDGEVLAAVVSEAIITNGETGPATVLRIVENAEMVETATRMAKALGLTGLCGFDFVLESDTGRAQLIELNPRATPTAHLRTAAGVDPLQALAAALARRPAPAAARPYVEEIVALFPQEFLRNPDSEYIRDGHHDIPRHAQDFVIAAEAGTGWLQDAVRRLIASRRRASSGSGTIAKLT